MADNKKLVLLVMTNPCIENFAFLNDRAINVEKCLMTWENSCYVLSDEKQVKNSLYSMILSLSGLL